MKEFLNLLPKELLVTVILGMIGLFVALLKIMSSMIKKQFEDANKKRVEQFNKIEKTIVDLDEKMIREIDNLNKQIEELKTELAKNSEGTNATLFSLLDANLRKAEITKVWSSSLSNQWWIMFKRYKNLGNGVDDGESLEQRAKKIEIDDVKYAENVANYNKHKKQMIESED